MNEQNWFRRFRQYGYETDVFDKYRDAVARYNRSALRVLGMTGCLAGVLTLTLREDSDTASGLIKGLRAHLEALAEQYPDCIKIITEV